MNELEDIRILVDRRALRHGDPDRDAARFQPGCTQADGDGVGRRGHPDYLSRRGVPVTTTDLQAHDCLQFCRDRGTSWLLREDGRDIAVTVSGPLRTNNGKTLRDAALAGLGLAQLPLFLTEDAPAEGRLLNVMDDRRPTSGAVYAIHPSHRQRSLPVRAFSDHLAMALH